MAEEIRLIDANALKQKLQSHYDFFIEARGSFYNLPNNDKIRADEISNCIAEVVNAPTIDAEPVRHGQWIDAGDYEECSICHYGRLKEFQSYYGKATRLWGKTNYCPYCGAKMNLEK